MRSRKYMFAGFRPVSKPVDLVVYWSECRNQLSLTETTVIYLYRIERFTQIDDIEGNG